MGNKFKLLQVGVNIYLINLLAKSNEENNTKTVMGKYIYIII